MKKKLLLLAIILFAVTAEVSAQCSMCKAVAQTGDGGAKAAGLNSAILYLMAVPYLLLFFFFRKRIIGFLKELRGLWN